MLWILVRALLCIAAINASYVHTYFVSDGDSPGVLQDIVDESLYLRVAIDHGHLLPQESIYREHAKSLPLSDLLTHWRPDQTYSHFLIGRFAVALGLRLQELNIALDIVSGILAYLTLYLCFRALLGKQHTLLAELATVIFLCFPWFASPENWVEFLSLWPSITATVGPVEHTTLPIQEGVESQLSCVWFALTLLSLILASKGGSPANRKMAVVGALTGLGLYTYTLEWIAATFLIPLLTCAMIFTYHHSPNILQVAKTLSIWLICNLAAALPGMIQIHAVRAEKSIFINSPSLYKTAYYIPIDTSVPLTFSQSQLTA
jgi:hypothetical protein